MGSSNSAISIVVCWSIIQTAGRNNYGKISLLLTKRVYYALNNPMFRYHQLSHTAIEGKINDIVYI